MSCQAEVRLVMNLGGFTCVGCGMGTLGSEDGPEHCVTIDAASVMVSRDRKS